jgi:precorrin-3B synthase
VPFPTTSDPAPRTTPDACPGALSLHEAADGALARIRLPGGQISAAALEGLAELADSYGDGRLELTSRGNVQLRALPVRPAGFADAVAALGLLPSATHERVRNILASPLAPNLIRYVRDLDRELCARPELARLPGRFLFGLDDGSGDIRSLAPDLAATEGELLGLRTDDVVEAMVTAAQAFLDERAAQGSQAWRLTELTDGPARVAARLQAALGLTAAEPRPMPTPPAEPVGAIAQADGRYSVVVLAPLGRLTTDQARLLAEQAADFRITPWRSVVVPDLADPEPVLAAAKNAGLGVDRTSRWYGLTACTGRPGCAKALADVQADARGSARVDSVPVHWSGCARRCGRPRTAHRDVLATTDGYVVTEPA